MFETNKYCVSSLVYFGVMESDICVFFPPPQGRKARLKVTRSSTAAQTRHTRGNPVSTYSNYSNSNSTSRISNGTSSVASEEYSNGVLEEP